VYEPHAGDAVEQMAREHAALRRVATFVARQPTPEEVFALVTREAGELLGARFTGLLRVESETTAVFVAGWARGGEVPLPVGSRGMLDGRGLMGRVLRTGRPVRLEDFDEAGGVAAEQMRRIGVRSAVAGPIVLGDRVWGALTAAYGDGLELPAGSEDPVAAFAELVAYAIDNAEAREELAASRLRLVEAADAQRRQVVRDIHDGAQQRLVHAVMTLQLANSRDDVTPQLESVLAEALGAAQAAIDDLRELARGLHPTLLTTRGLRAAVEGLADRAPVPVQIEIPERRWPRSVEAAAYFVVAEALTNVAKYARASHVTVRVAARDGRLHVLVEDDGAGGALATAGSGLSGLQDRVVALDGTFSVDSPAGGGTRVMVEVPVPPPAAGDSLSPADRGSAGSGTPR
jgi:signal transduction histidine kinase